MSTEETKTTQRKRKWDVTEAGEPDAQRVKVSPPQPSNGGTPTSSVDSSEAAAQQALERATAAASRILSQLSSKGSALSTDVTGMKAGLKEEFFKDVPINDIKNRYLLTKGATQLKIKQDTGADIISRGRYYPDPKLATEKDPPLYLHVSAATQESLDAALAAIDELINQAPPAFSEERRASGGDRGPPRPFFQEKVFVGIEADRMFNVRAKIVGPGGQFVKHIQQETQTKVQLKGLGSGYIERDSGQEAPEPLHIHITGFAEDAVAKAKTLCEDLVETVKAEFERNKQQRAAAMNRPPPPRPPATGYVPYPGQPYPTPQPYAQYPAQWGTEATAYAPYGGYDVNQYYGYYYPNGGESYAPPSGAPPPPPPAPPSMPDPPPPPPPT